MTAFHPTMRLGLRPADLSRPVLKFAQMRSGAVPAHPLTADHFTGVAWGMYGNDQFSTCGPTTVANIRRAITRILGGTEIDPTVDDVFDLYRRSGNPSFDGKGGGDDNGVVMAEMLAALLKGGIGGVKPVAYAQVNVKDLDEVRAAVSIFGALAMGSDLDVAQQKQTDAGLWDYVPRSQEWGGHATPAFGYTSARTGRDFTIATWAKTIGVTDAFWTRRVQEAWVIIWPEHLGTVQFQQGIDGNAANAAYTALTGGRGPFPTTPAPINPTPVPAVDPRAVADTTLIRAMDAWKATR
jgi:hypothetical protein